MICEFDIGMMPADIFEWLEANGKCFNNMGTELPYTTDSFEDVYWLFEVCNQ